MVEVKIRKIGNSYGLVLPKETQAQMKVSEGDTLYLTESPDGGFRLTPANPEFARQLEISMVTNELDSYPWWFSWSEMGYSS